MHCKSFGCDSPVLFSILHSTPLLQLPNTMSLPFLSLRLSIFSDCVTACLSLSSSLSNSIYRPSISKLCEGTLPSSQLPLRVSIGYLSWRLLIIFQARWQNLLLTSPSSVCPPDCPKNRAKCPGQVRAFELH